MRFPWQFGWGLHFLEYSAVSYVGHFPAFKRMQPSYSGVQKSKKNARAGPEEEYIGTMLPSWLAAIVGGPVRYMLVISSRQNRPYKGPECGVCKRSCTPSGHDRGSGEQPRQLDGGNKSDRGTLNHILCQAKCMLWLATMSSMGAFTAHCATWSPVNVVQKGKGMLQSVPVMWSLVCGVR